MARPRPQIPVSAALPLVLGLPVVGVAAALLKGSLGPRFSGAAVLTAASALGIVLVGLGHRRISRATLAAALACAPWILLVGLGALSVADDALVHDPVATKCGTGLMAAILFAVPVGGVLVVAASGALAAMSMSRRFDGAFRVAGIGGTAVAMLGLAFAAPRLGRPDADTYVARVPVVAELSVGEAVRIGGVPLRYAEVEPPVSDPADDPEVPSLPPGGYRECSLEGLEGLPPLGDASFGCPRVRVRLDEAGDFAIVEALYPGALEGTWGRVAAFRPSTGRTTAIRPSDLKGRLAPPLGWVAGAAIGGTAGVLFLALARRTRRRAAGVAGEDARHEGDGWLVLGDARRVRVPSAASLLVGDVTVELEGERGETYREAASPGVLRVTPGRVADARAALVDLAVGLEASAFAVAGLGAAPLVAARVFGLV